MENQSTDKVRQPWDEEVLVADFGNRIRYLKGQRNKFVSAQPWEVRTEDARGLKIMPIITLPNGTPISFPVSVFRTEEEAQRICDAHNGTPDRE